MTEVDLDELGPWLPVPLHDDQAVALLESKVVDVRRAVVGAAYEVRAAGWVGAARIAGVDLRIRPKVTVARLLFLLGHARDTRAWRDDTVGVAVGAELLPAMADALWRQVDRALQGGLLQGYQVVEDALPLVRGRIREADQLRRRFGRALPVEIRYDDFTTDIAENRILRTAVDRMLALPSISADARARLARQRVRLAEVTSLPFGVVRPVWRSSRLNEHYAPALRLAEIVLDGTSVEPLRGPVAASGLLVSMPRLFEDFVTSVLGERLTARRGRVVAQDTARSLDLDGYVPLRPDLVWYDGVRPLAVVDAKYKAEKPEGFPGADAYQLLAYCTAYGLRRGHLVYAAGNDQPPAYRITGAGVEVATHTLDLAAVPATLLRRVEGLAAAVVEAVQDEDVDVLTGGS